MRRQIKKTVLRIGEVRSRPFAPPSNAEVAEESGRPVARCTPAGLGEPLTSCLFFDLVCFHCEMVSSLDRANAMATTKNASTLLSFSERRFYECAHGTHWNSLFGRRPTV
jgi:hypothetical protein